MHGMISTRDLSLLPDVRGLRRILQLMAMLDAIVCPEWESRYYSFNSAWDANEQMASMRNGSVDSFFAHFSREGCLLNGFAHECATTPYRENPKRTWPGVLDGVPNEFAACLREPAFSVDDATFCIWRRPNDRGWQTGTIEFPSGTSDPDGSERLLSILDGRPESYRAWAENYFDREVPAEAVIHVYQHRPLSPEVVAILNPDSSLAELAAHLAEIGYPN
jgi:hypothetical protein